MMLAQIIFFGLFILNGEIHRYRPVMVVVLFSSFRYNYCDFRKRVVDEEA